MATPLTELRLLNNIDLDTTYNNTFSRALFGNLAGQISFFSGKTVYSFTNLTFQRKERTIKVKRAYEDIEPLSYGMFKNGTSGKWYFFFITDYMYVSENVTEIKIEIDVEQTYLFDVTIADSFVEREHVESDDIGEHLIDENLSTGEYTIRATDTFLDLNPQSVVIASTYDPIAGLDSFGTIQTGIYQGAALFAFDRTDVVGLDNFLQLLTTAAKEESIVSIFMMPTNLLPSYTSGDKIDVPNAQVLYFNYPKNTSDIDGYIPKNNKLFTYPYNVLYVSNHNGSFATYRYEFSDASQMEFQATGNVAPSPIVSLIPRSYKGAVVNFDEIFRLADYPLCSWTTDAFKGYLAQNAVSAPLSIASSGLAAAGTLGGIGAAAGATAVGTVAAPIAVGAAVIGIASTIGNFVEASLQSNQLKGSISGGSNTAIGIQTFAFYPKTIRAEQARVIDDFFTKYGYKVNQVKTPNITSRTRHNYLKVQDCILKGNVPREALSVMIQNRTKGITFWHVNDIGNYTPTNGFA